jgi:K+-sensing histidine kinase KdpD
VLVDATPFARTLIRRGWRLAQGMHADLLVAYIAPPDGSVPSELARSLELAEDLNAAIRTITGGDEAALIATLKAEGANHVVLVYRPSSGMRRLTTTPLHERIMRALPNVDVHLISDP